LPSTCITKVALLSFSQSPLVDRLIINQSWNATKKTNHDPPSLSNYNNTKKKLIKEVAIVATKATTQTL
jgi:hypothetical protein